MQSPKQVTTSDLMLSVNQKYKILWRQKMKMDIVAGSGVDEFYTPPYAVRPILKYIKKHSIIWCPFDTEESWFVKLSREEGHTVIATHISEGHDFFEINAPNCDYIISNPPYSKKGEVLNLLFEYNIPFGMLVGVVGLFESQERFNMFAHNDFEIMYLDKRVSFFKSFTEQTHSLNPPFSSVYVCKGILPKQIIFETVNKKLDTIKTQQAIMDMQDGGKNES